jgi:DNA-binding NarL/FixJ family response regulator
VIRILLADDHAVVRRGLRLVLETEPDLRVVSEVGDGAEAVRQAMRDDVDLAVLDLTMPRMSGLDATREITHLKRRIPILILSVHDNEEYLSQAMRAGASGYVLKSVADHELIRACRLAMRGEPFIRPETHLRHSRWRSLIGDETDLTRLTNRETEILALIAAGNTANDIAGMLFISPRTVERHRENLLAKLGMHSRTELTRYAIRIGLIQP